ncbi:MAG: leukotoxin LktA family filamentous adhesin, partial [Veillonellales bacterium]
MKMQRKWRRAWQRGHRSYYRGWWLKQQQQKTLIATRQKRVQSKRASRFTRWVSPAAAAAIMVATMNFGIPVTDAANNNIATDGKTGTTVNDVNSKVTNITTTTTTGNGATGINSFSRFNVTAGNTVNMILPAGAANLINLVNGGSQSQIYGALNSIKDNKIGGNLYFLNPQGVLVGRNENGTGSINAGSLAIYTPTQDFVNKFFDSNNQLNTTSVQQVMDGTLPIDPTGLIYIQGGSVNAVNSIKLNNVRIGEGAEVNVGANFDTSGSTA